MTFRLLVGYEGTDSGRQVLSYIAPLAQDPTVEITLLTVARGAAGSRLVEQARELLAPAQIEHIAATGSMYNALLQAARSPAYDLVVFGQLGRKWVPWSPLQHPRSLSTALPISSLMVQGQGSRITRALICAGGDETVIADARLTARLVRRMGAGVTILHVLSQVPVVFGKGVQRDRITEAFAAIGAPEMKHMQAAAAELRSAGVEATIKVRVGLVVEEIVAELAEGSYDLLVIGAHRSSGLVERLLLEDVTADILGHSPVPVLVVKAQQPKGAREPSA